MLEYSNLKNHTIKAMLGLDERLNFDRDLFSKSVVVAQDICSAASMKKAEETGKLKYENKGLFGSAHRAPKVREAGSKVAGFSDDLTADDLKLVNGAAHTIFSLANQELYQWFQSLPLTEI